MEKIDDLDLFTIENIFTLDLKQQTRATIRLFTNDDENKLYFFSLSNNTILYYNKEKNTKNWMLRKIILFIKLSINLFTKFSTKTAPYIKTFNLLFSSSAKSTSISCPPLTLMN